MSSGSQNALQHLRGISTLLPDDFSFSDFDEFGSSLAIVSSRTVLEALESASWPGLDDMFQRALGSEQCAIDWDLPEETQSCFEESLYTQFGTKLRNHPRSFGHVSTEIPFAALTAGPDAAVRSARRLVQMYEELNVPAERLLLRVPASYGGLRVAEALHREGVAKVHVTHVYSLEQALLAKEAGAFAVQIYVGRVDRAGGDGVALARDIYRLLQENKEDGPDGPQTALIVGSLESIADISAVAGADYLLVPPQLLRQLRDQPAGEVAGGAGILAPPAFDGEPPRSKLRSAFCLSQQEFEASLPELATDLLAKGLAAYKVQYAALDQLINQAKEYI